METSSVLKNHSALKFLSNKFTICTLFAFFAALSVLSYGYRFPQYFELANPIVLVGLGVLSAACSMLANVMLGSYSLMNMKSRENPHLNSKILTLSLVGSTPYGFLSFFGNHSFLPLGVNLVSSIIVVVVNAGISYTAINGFLNDFNQFMAKRTKFKFSFADIFVRMIGVIIGLFVSVIMYLMTCHGINNLFSLYGGDVFIQYHVGYALALISWLPIAVLFANANQIVAGELLAKLQESNTFKRSFTFKNISLILFCLFSGTAIGQMLIDAFDPSHMIPELFKKDLVENIVHQYLIGVSIVASAALNYFALNKFFENFNKKN